MKKPILICKCKPNYIFRAYGTVYSSTYTLQSGCPKRRKKTITTKPMMRMESELHALIGLSAIIDNIKPNGIKRIHSFNSL